MQEADGDNEEIPDEVKNDLIGFSNETAMTLQISQLKALSTYITSKIAENKNEMDSLLEEREQVLWEIGNLVHSSVPVSDDEENNVVERIYLPDKGVVTDSGEIDSMKKLMRYAPISENSGPIWENSESLG